MQAQVESFISQFQNVFYGEPWYGDGVIEKLDKTDSRIVAISPIGKLHSIVQLVRHMTAWKKYLIEKMNGNDNYKIVEDSDVEWPPKSSTDNWAAAVDELKEMHDLLIEGLKQKSDDWLLLTIPGTERTYGSLVQGVIHHDIYHVGQIGIASKMLEENKQ